MQRPPTYSAVRVAGPQAYERARDGEQFEVPEREVTVYRFEQLWREDDRAEFLIECSSGTYVRSLIADLGDAYCEELRRTRIGPFAVEDADPQRVLPLERGAGLHAAHRDRRRRRVARRPSGRSIRRRVATPSTSCWSTPTGRSRSPSRGRTAC